MADPRDLVTIVGNLLDNAVDAAAEAPAPRWVRLEAGVLTVDGVEELELAVADSGPGLGPDAAAHAFDRGWTTKKTDRPMGRGVGLALVAQAVHRLGGAIAVVNEVGRGVHRAPAPARRGASAIARCRSPDDPAGSPSTSRSRTKPVTPGPRSGRERCRADAPRLPSSCRTQVSGLPSSA